MKLVALITFLIFSFECLASVTPHVTDFVRFEHSGSYPLLTFINSTSKVYRVGLQAENEASLFSISKDSTFTLDSSSLVSHGSFIPFSLAGQLFLSSFSVSLQNAYSSLGSLALTESPFQVDDTSASISVSSSSFVDLPLSSNLGTFVSSGLIDSQAVENCVFSNVTIHDASETGTLTIADKCRLENSVIENSQDTFYGLIVSGMSSKTNSWFCSMNSTFTNCVRQNPLLYPTIRRLAENVDETAVGRIEDGSTTTGTQITRFILERTYWSGGKYTFTGCSWTSCSTKSSGGALYQTKVSYNSALLNISSCSFTSCYASIHGGAVYSDYTTTQQITDSNFTANSIAGSDYKLTEKVSREGGAVLSNYTSTLYVWNNRFVDNRAPSRGGGLYLGNIQNAQTGHIVQDCFFYNNTANYTITDADGTPLNYIAGIAGGLYILTLQFGTVGNCLFEKNYAGYHGAGLIYGYHDPPSKPAFHWLVFRNNFAHQGIDIYIRAPKMYNSICDAWTFTDYDYYPPGPNRYQYNTSANEKTAEYNDDWLAVGPALFVNTNPSKVNQTSCREYYSNTKCKTLSDVITALSGEDEPDLQDVITARALLVSNQAHSETKSINIGNKILTFDVYTPPSQSSATTLTINSTYADNKAVFLVEAGWALFYHFTISVQVALQVPVIEVETGKDGHLLFDNMTIQSTNTMVHKQSIISASKGQLTFYGTTLTTITLENAPVISVDPNSPYYIRFFDGSKISSITRNTGDGAVFEITYPENTYKFNVIISGLSCTDCSAKNGNGGAIAAYMLGGKALILSNSSFKNCSTTKLGGAIYIDVPEQYETTSVQVQNSTFSSPYDDKEGAYIYIKCVDGEKIGDPANWNGTIDTFSKDSNLQKYYWVKESIQSRRPFEQSLYYFIFSPADKDVNIPEDQQVMIVDSSDDSTTRGADIRTCGWDVLRCKTIYSAYTKRGELETIQLQGYADAGNPTVGSTPYTISTNVKITQLSAVPKPKMIIGSDWTYSSAIFTVQHETTTFENIDIDLKTSLGARAIFVTVPYVKNENYNGKIVLDTVTITQSGSGSGTSYYFFRLSGAGTLELKKVDVQNFVMSNYSLIGVSTQVRSHLTIQNSKFTKVDSTNGKGSVLSLLTSCNCDIKLDTVTFADCSSSEGFGAIFDNESLTDPTTNVVDQRTTITCKALKFTKDDTAITQYVYFREPGTYMFDSTNTALWKSIIGAGENWNTGESYYTEGTFYRGVASGENEPQTGFSLGHVCFTPKQADQTALYVAGTVNGEIQYYDIAGCGWEDIPCKTIAQAAAHVTKESTITLCSGTHNAETDPIEFSSKITVTGASPSKVAKKVSSLSSAVFSIKAAVTFEELAFTMDDYVPVFLIKSGGELKLENLVFEVKASTSSEHLITIESPSTDSLDIASSVTFSTPETTTKGAYIYVKGSGTAFEGKLTGKFPPSECTSSTADLSFVNETDTTLPPTDPQESSLVHFIYPPAYDNDGAVVLTGATEMHVLSTGANDPTCGWKDLPCKTLQQALTKRGKLSTVVLHSDTEISESATIEKTSLTIQGDSKPKITFASSITSSAVFAVNEGLTLSLSGLSLVLSDCTDLFSVSGTLSFESVDCTTSQSIKHAIILMDGSKKSTLSITNSNFSSPTTGAHTLSHALITFTTSTDSSKITVSITGSRFENLDSGTSGTPAVLNCPTGSDAYHKLTLLMDTDTFTNCRSTASAGGAIYVAQGPASSVKLLSSTLEKCQCAESGRGDFMYLQCTGFTGTYETSKLNLLISSVVCTHRDNAASLTTSSRGGKFSGFQLFIQDENLDKRVDGSMFAVDTNSVTDPQGGTTTTNYYSFWGQIVDGGEVDLLFKYNFYRAKTIYVKADSTADIKPNECGPTDKPCKDLTVGATHLIPSLDKSGSPRSYIRLVAASTPIEAETSLRNLVLLPDTANTATLTVTEANSKVPSFTVSGTISVERIVFEVGTLTTTSCFKVADSAKLTLSACSFKAADITLSFFDVNNSTLILENLVTEALTCSQPFISVAGQQGKVEIRQSGTGKSSISTSGNLLSSSESATMIASNTEFKSSTINAPLFSFGGNASFTDGCTITKAGGNKVDVQTSIILVSGEAHLSFTKTTFEELNMNSETASIISDQDGADKGPLESLTLTDCTFTNINQHTKPLFYTTTLKELTVSKSETGCTFTNILHQTGTTIFAPPETASVSISDAQFLFPAEGTMTNLVSLYGGSKLTDCTFTKASGVTDFVIKGTLLTILSSTANLPLTLQTCHFTNIKSTETAAIIKSTGSKLILDTVECTFVSNAQLKGPLMSTGDMSTGDVDLKGCNINKEGVSVICEDHLFNVAGSISITSSTLSTFTLSKAIIKLTGDDKEVTIASSEIKAISTNIETPIIVDSSKHPQHCTVTGTTFSGTSTKQHLFEVTDGYSFSSVKFEASSPTTLTTPLITLAAGATIAFTDCTFTNLATDSGKALISGTTGTVSITGTSTDKSWYKPGQASNSFISLSDTSAVHLISCTLEGTVDKKLSSALIKATTITLNDCSIQSFDHTTTAATLFDGAFTITNCNVANVKQDSAAHPLLTPTANTPTSLTNTKFTYPAASTSLQNVLTIYGGSILTDVVFEPAEGANSVAASGTIVTIPSEGTSKDTVTFTGCQFVNLASTTSDKPVIKCAKDGLTVVFEDTSFTFISEAPIYVLLETKNSVEFTASSISLAQGQTKKALLHKNLFTVEKDASLVLSSSTISDLTISSAGACLIATPTADAASIVIDSTDFNDVDQSKTATTPLFNTNNLLSFTIIGCTFNCIDQSVNQPLLSAPHQFTITSTTFILPRKIEHPILQVTKNVVFSNCTFKSQNTEEVPETEITKPIIDVVGRTDLSLLDCKFNRIKATTSETTVDNKKTTVTVPAIVELGDSVSLTARNCIFTTISSAIKIGQIFNAHSSAVFDNCVFNETVINEEGSEICYWNASIVQLSGGDCTLKNTQFHNISQGALGISGGAHVTIDGWDFAENHPKLTGYEKMQRNINCTEHSMLTVKDDNIDKDSSLYLIQDTCTVDYKLATGKSAPTSPFFIPTLESCKPEMDGLSTLILTFHGTDLIPCSLQFQIFLAGNDKEPAFTGPITKDGKSDHVEGARSNQEATEETAAASTTDRVQSVDLSNTPEIYGKTADKVRLSYGEGEDKKTKTIEMKPSVTFPTARQAQSGQATEPEDDDKWAWWMWLIIGGGSFLFLLIVILCIVCCCCQDDEEKEEDEDEDMEDVKTVSAETLMALNTKDLLPNTAFKDFDANKVVTVEAMNTTAPYDKTVISAKKSIYYQIHNPSHRQDHNPFMWSATIAYHICNGVEHILDTIYNDQPTSSNEVGVDVMKTILNTLSPHCIFAGDRDAILLGSVPNNYQVPVSANSKEGKTDFSLECQRYRSPEMTQHPNDDSRAMKESNAVFAIGFIMYEVFTGWLVFDGYPHSRVVEMVASGARPDLVLVRSVDSNFASIIEAATNMDAEQRPTIAQLLERIDMYLPNDLRKGAQQHFARSLLDDDDDDL